MNILPPRIIYFTPNMYITDMQRLEAASVRGDVVFRNAAFVFDASEECDGVMGTIPEAYANHPTAEDAIKAYEAKIEEIKSNLGSATEPAPDLTEPKVVDDDGKVKATAGWKAN